MELRDFIVTPIILLLIYVGAYHVRPYVTDSINRRYFLPALSLKLFGALALGFIYQFYYGNGDTFMYHTSGSRLVWQAFGDSPLTGLRLLFSNGSHNSDIYQYSSRIYFFRDQSSFAVVRMAALIDLLTFATYSATAALFAVFSFFGTWQFFMTFYRQYPHLHKSLATASFFVPSVFFWGSGILKDTITLGCLGIATYQIYKIFFEKKYGVTGIILLLGSLYMIFSVKKFILQAYIPAVIIWVVAWHVNFLPSMVLKIMLLPFVLALLMTASYYSVVKIGEDDGRYSIGKIAQTAKKTAYDIRYWSGRDAGSGYSLGDLDGSFGSMLRLAPAAINVSLFRPYLWEVKNPLMLLSALESLILLALVLYLIFNRRMKVLFAFRDPSIAFALVFSIMFAFAVGVSTYNFGTLSRYKIPLLPFFIVALILIGDYTKRQPTVPEAPR